jgi:AcrR family transcriptional regulator
MSVTDSGERPFVSKVPAHDVRSKLQDAAVELFQEQGYERTTAAEIAKRVGVTERTFFRHFVDKREVLFDGEAVLRAALAEAIGACPKGMEPVDVLFAAFHSVLTLLYANRPFSVPRQAIIAATPALRERELAKHASLSEGLAGMLVARGVGRSRATLAAQTAMGAFVYATMAWLDDPAETLEVRLNRAREQIAELFAPANTLCG